MTASEATEANIYIFERFEDINPTKIQGKAVVLIKSGEYQYITYCVDKHRFQVDKEGDPIVRFIELSKKEGKLISKNHLGKKIKRGIKNSSTLNTLINNATEKTTLNWKTDYIAKNCVYAAVNIFTDFFLEYRDKKNAYGRPYFEETERNEIDAMLNDIISMTSKRPHTGQGALLRNFETWGKNRLERQSREIKGRNDQIL
ncbi:MAG: hypothetical protein H0T62_14665 [Parachlamydiaceae bacterium]|nr:hypothetical protein [Parachlamydiaceae bacterium]